MRMSFPRAALILSLVTGFLGPVVSGQEPAVLPLDARVTDGALGVVPDSKRRTHS